MDHKNNYDDKGNNVFVEHNHDILSELLIRVDPSSILKCCMLVSKEWLSVITCPVFRRSYLNKWKDSSSEILGLLMYNPTAIVERRCPRAQFLPTSKLGKYIKYWNSALGAGHYGFLMSKSPKGGLLLFGGVDSYRWYVFKPVMRGLPVELPPPPAIYERCLAYIQCNDDDDDDGDDYMVILARQSIKDDYSYTNYIEVSIQTFYSRTGKWEQYTPSSLRQLSIIEHGTVSRGGDIIYWRVRKGTKDCLAAWDVNGGRVSVIPEPPFIVTRGNTIGYGWCPKGSLLASTYIVFEDYHDINIWTFDGDDKKEWELLYNVSQESILNNNLPLSTMLPEGEFVFVSFIPGKLDSIFVGLENQLFVYHFPTGNLEHVELFKYGLDKSFNFNSFVKYHPLTMLDLGIWASSPPSLQLSN